MGTRTYPIGAMRAMRNAVLSLCLLLLAGCGSAAVVNDPPVALVPILFATDRAATGSQRANDGYGPAPGDLTFGWAEISIPASHRLGATETPQLARIEIGEDPARHVLLRRIEPLGRSTFVAALRERLKRSPERSVLVFVHGYNVEFATAARRTAQIAHDLNWRGVALLYSWPSGGRTTDYLADSQNAPQTSRHLAEVLTLLAQESRAAPIHVLAHSMGAVPTLMALAQFDPPATGRARPLVGELMLAAPDIDAGVFRTMVATAAPRAERVTVYVSRRDEVLQLSSALHGAARAGDGEDAVVTVPGVDTIDASAVDGSLLGHSYYGGNRSVLTDIFLLLTARTSPERRFGLQQAIGNGQPYWILKP